VGTNIALNPWLYWRSVFWPNRGFVRVLVLVAALMPAGLVPTILPWDKAQHFIAFYVLTLAQPATAIPSSEVRPEELKTVD
jgi:hypothetical protein